MKVITEEDLARARLKLKRRISAVLLATMADLDVDFTLLDERTRNSAGWSRRYLDELIDGTTNALDPLSDICLAMDCEPEFAIRKIALSLSEIGGNEGDR